MNTTPPRPKGFAALDPDKLVVLSSMGGTAAHKAGKAYRFTPEKAREAAAKRHAMRKTQP